MDQMSNQRLEYVDSIYRDKILIDFPGNGKRPSARNGTIYNRGSVSPYRGNIRGDNWHCNSLVRMVTSRIAAVRSVSRLVVVDENGASPPDPSICPYHFQLIMEMLENLFITLRVNSKEYLKDVPLTALPNYSRMTQGADYLHSTVALQPEGFQTTLISYAPNVRQVTKTSSGGLLLPVPIEIAHGDSVSVDWRMGDEANMPGWVAMNADPLLGFAREDGVMTTGWGLDIELAIHTTDRRIVQ